jgi:hypothetical protein
MLSHARSRLILFLILLNLFVPPTHAQQAPKVESLEVAFWPEFDEPKMLVFYRAQLPLDTPMPAIISLPIPARVGEPLAVAKWHTDGSLDDQVEWNRQVDGQWATIQIQTDTPGVWLEYYDVLTFDGDERSYVFEWPGGVEVEEFSYELQHPPEAREVKITPAGEFASGDFGLAYTRGEIGYQASSSTFSLEVSYQKSSGALTNELLSAPSSALESLQVSLWPEYDRAAVLVFYRARLPDDTPLPATVRLPVPAGVGTPLAVAQWFPDGRLSDNVPWNRQVTGEWATIEILTNTTGVWVEYYADLQIDDQKRDFTFNWPGGIDVDSFNYEVQQPTGASDFQVTPVGTSSVHNDGFLYHEGAFGAQSSSSTISFSLTYNNPTSQLSESPSLVRPEVTQGGTPDLGTWLPWVLGIFGVGLLAFGIIFFLRSSRPQVRAPSARRRRRPSKKKKEEGERVVDASPVFCHICGTQAAVSDHFCRRCGTQLRR